MEKVRNQIGMTLVELVVATALTVVMGLLTVSALLLMNAKSAYVKTSVDLEDSYRLLSFVLPLSLGQAVDVDWTNAAIGDIGTSRGRLRIFNSGFSNLSGTQLPDPVPVGVYLREAARPGSTSTGSDLRATGIYFRPPTRLTEGELSIVSSAAGSGRVTLDPQNASQKFGSIVEFDVSPTNPGLERNGEPVRSARIRIVFRKFIGGEKSQRRWCPRAQMVAGIGNCATQASFRDIERMIDVALLNNVIETDFVDGTDFNNTVRQKETLHGDLYFFRTRIR